MEEKGIADFPRPVYGRIPNFKGSDQACELLAKLDVFRKANVVKVNPDSPQRKIREICLEEGKILIMPTPRIRQGFLLLDPDKIPKYSYSDASTIKGAFRWGVRVEPWNLPNVDLIVIGSVVVNLKGIRLGKGEGYAELEWGILRECSKVNENIPIVTTVHDVQIVNIDIPFDEYDLPVDLIVTPNKVIEVKEKAKEKPKGIYWNKLSLEKFESIPILKELKNRLKER